MYIAKFLMNGTFGWVRGFGGANANSYVGSNSIATDSTGGIYVTGYLNGAVNFDATGGSDVHSDSTSSGTTFTTKYLSSGAYGWTKTFDNSPGSQSYSSSYGQAIATDTVGGIYVLSAVTGPMNYAGNGGNDTIDETQSGALTKYNADGGYAWTKVFHTLNGSNAVTTQGVYAGVAADLLGNVYVSSVFNGTVGFDGAGGSDQQTSSGYLGTFLTSYRAFDPAASQPVAANQANGVTSVVTTPAAIKATSQTRVPDTGYGLSAHTEPKLPLFLAAAGLVSIVVGRRFKKPGVAQVAQGKDHPCI